MLLGVFGAFGSGKTLYLVRKAAEAMNKCINCPKDTYPHMKHMHQTLRLKDGTLVKGKCTRMIPSEDRNGRPYHCPCTGFKPVRVLSNLNIKGAEQIGLPEFHNILTEDEVREYENEPEFMRLQNSRDDKRTDADIVTKFENAGFIVIHRDEIALVIIDEAWCIPSDTLVLGDNKQAKDLTLQNKVVTMNGLEDIVHLDMLYYVGDKRPCLQEIKAMGLLPIKVTPNHPLMTWTLKNRVPIEQGFVQAAQLKPKGDYIAIPILQGSDETEISSSLAWLLGLYVAEGSVGDHQIFFSLNSNEQYLADKIKSIVSGRQVSQTQLARHTMNVYFTDRELVKILPDLCGSNAHTKKIPDFVLYNKNLEILRAFLEGYFVGDGYFVEQGIESKTVSPLLAMQLQLAIARFGIPAYISKTSKYYRVTINADPQHKHAKVIQDKILYPVLSNKKLSYDGFVHNIVTPSHTFLVSNAITHNTWMDARMSGSQQNRAADVVILQSRKKSIDIAYCFDPETIILGDNKKASEYKVGDYVIGQNGLQKVTQTNVFDSTLVEVKGQGLLPIRVTPNHPFFVQKSKTNKQRQISGFREPVWKLAQDLIPKKSGKIGDYLTIPRLQGIYETLSIDLRPYTKDVKITPHTTRLDFPLSYDTAWLLGAYVAEGHTTESNNVVTFSLSEDEPQFTQRIMSILKDLGYSAWIQHDKRSKGLQIHFKSRILTKTFCDWCGQGTHNKKIPEFILLHKDINILKAFLKGYAEGDGCQQNTGWTSLHTVSKLLALQLQLAHARLGTFYGIVKSDTTGQSHLAKDGHLIKGGISYQLNSYETAWQVKIFPDKILVPVRSVKHIATKVPVINLETEDHTILANNSLSHNSAQLPSSTDKRLRLNTEVAVIAKKIKKNRKVVAFRYVTASDTKCQVYRLPVEKAKTYYDMYSTRESINRPMMFDEELNFRIRFLMEAVKKRRQRNLRDYQRMVLQTQKDAIERMQAADESLENSKKGTGPATSLLEIQPKNYPVKAEPLPEITPVAPNAEVEYADEKHYDET